MVPIAMSALCKLSHELRSSARAHLSSSAAQFLVRRLDARDLRRVESISRAYSGVDQHPRDSTLVPVSTAGEDAASYSLGEKGRALDSNESVDR